MPKPMTREEFQVYLDYFNTQDFDGILSYFADGCVLKYHTDWGPGKPVYENLEGKQGFRENYINIYENFEERLRLGVYMSTEDTIFIELYTSFTAKKDVSMRFGSLEKGQTFYCNQYIDYDLDENGKFINIRIAQFDSQDYPDERFFGVA